ncbi:hypothetical protein Tco_0886349 [Tanacetum coccineum]
MWREEIAKATPEIVEKMMKKKIRVRVLKVVTPTEAIWMVMVSARKSKERVMKWSEFVLQIELVVKAIFLLKEQERLCWNGVNWC